MSSDDKTKEIKILDNLYNDNIKKNLIDFLKLKSHVINCSIKNTNKIINLEILKKVFCIEYKTVNAIIDRIILRYDDNVYVFHISFSMINEINKNKIINDTEINYENVNIYPNIIYVLENTQLLKKNKNIDIKEFDIINKKKLYCNLKHTLFKLENEIINIELITKEKYENIKILAYSPYTNEKLNDYSLSINDFALNIFYVPNEKVSNIRGLKYETKSPSSIISLDYRFIKIKD